MTHVSKRASPDFSRLTVTTVSVRALNGIHKGGGAVGHVSPQQPEAKAVCWAGGAIGKARPGLAELRAELDRAFDASMFHAFNQV